MLRLSFRTICCVAALGSISWIAEETATLQEPVQIEAEITPSGTTILRSSSSWTRYRYTWNKERFEVQFVVKPTVSVFADEMVIQTSMILNGGLVIHQVIAKNRPSGTPDEIFTAFKNALMNSGYIIDTVTVSTILGQPSLFVQSHNDALQNPYTKDQIILSNVNMYQIHGESFTPTNFPTKSVIDSLFVQVVNYFKILR